MCANLPLAIPATLNIQPSNCRLGGWSAQGSASEFMRRVDCSARRLHLTRNRAPDHTRAKIPQNLVVVHETSLIYVVG